MFLPALLRTPVSDPPFKSWELGKELLVELSGCILGENSWARKYQETYLEGAMALYYIIGAHAWLELHSRLQVIIWIQIVTYLSK